MFDRGLAFDVLALGTAYRINKLCKVFHLDEVTSKVSNVCSRELEDCPCDVQRF
jgi:hypothetical protein